MMMSPPLPPSPPEGPPRGTNFSRRKARHPLPPSPAFTRILASSINIVVLGAHAKQKNASSRRRGCELRSHPRGAVLKLFRFQGVDHHTLAHLTFVENLAT